MTTDSASLTAPTAMFHRAMTLAIVVFGSIGVVMLNVQPAVELHLGQDLGLSPSMIGTFFFVELLAMGLATLPSYYWLDRVDSKFIAYAACAVFALANVASASLLHDFSLLLVARTCAGFAAGTMMVLSMTTAATAKNPDRMYALLVIVQIATGAVLLYFMPDVLGMGNGLAAFFYLNAVLGIAALPLSGQFTEPLRSSAAASTRKQNSLRAEFWRIVLVIAATASFNMAVGALWAFAGEWAVAAGLTAERTATILSLSSIAGIAGAVVPFILGDGIRRSHMLLLGKAVFLLGMAGIHFAHGEGMYAIGVVLLAVGWNFCVPYIISAVAACDRSGHLVSSISLAFGTGLAFGPLVAGELIERSGLDLLAIAIAGLLLFSAALMQRIAHLPAKPGA